MWVHTFFEGAMLRASFVIKDHLVSIKVILNYQFSQMTKGYIVASQSKWFFRIVNIFKNEELKEFCSPLST